MARQRLTFEEVAAAAASLHNDGKQVTIDALRDALGTDSSHALHKHLLAWRADRAEPLEAPDATLPETLASALGSWAQQYAEEASAGIRAALAQAESDLASLLEVSEQLDAERDELLAQSVGLAAARDEALATATERAEEIDRLTVELRNARQVATEALVGKAKDQLAIEGKDAQLKDLRAQIERNVAATAVESDARLAAEMELVGAATARDNLAAELSDLRTQLDACMAERSALRVEVQVLRAQGAG